MKPASDDLTIAWEPLAVLRDDGIEDLIRREWEEVAVNRESMPLALDWDQYHSLEELKLFRCFGCRRQGTLIGFSSFMTMPGHLHYRTTAHAMNDAIYVAPEERGIVGLRLILEAERQLQAIYAPKSVRVLYYSKDDIILGRRAFTDNVDSLEIAEEAIRLMEDYGIELPQEDPPIQGSLGDLLAYIGYRRFETAYGKFVGG